MGFKSILKTAFPFIAAAAGAGGPLGVMAAGAVGKALGVDKIDGGHEGIEAAIADAQTKDPNALLKLTQAEEEFQLQMTKLGFDSAAKLAEIDASDRASARAREMAVRDHTPAILAFLVSGGFFGMLVWITFHEIPVSSHDVVMVLIGALGAAFTGVVGYYFGSSSGSAAKTQILAKQTENSDGAK